MKNKNKEKKKNLSQPRFEPGTVSSLSQRANHYNKIPVMARGQKYCGMMIKVKTENLSF